MSSRKLDKISADVDDAKLAVDELKDGPPKEAKEKLKELEDTLEHAADTIDKLASKNTAD